MPGPEQLIRAAVTLPFTIARTVAGIAWDLLPGTGTEAEPPAETQVVAPQPPVVVPEPPAVTQEPEPDPIEPAHIEPEIELVAESADPEAPDPPGPELHVDEPWEGYRRMKVSEIAAQLEGQPSEVLAAVELYESTHRNRPGVLEAVRSASRA
jgi:hypothetical protein